MEVSRQLHAPSPSTTAQLARGLGWFSIVLGVAELAAPRWVSRLCGLRQGHETMMRLYGLREIAAGAAILAGRDPRPGLWARAGGDMVDLASLALSGKSGRHSGRTGMAIANVAAITALDIYTARTYTPAPPPPSQYGYGDCSGFPRDASAMRAAALKDFQMPEDMRVPSALAPWDTASQAARH